MSLIVSLVPETPVEGLSCAGTVAREPMVRNPTVTRRLEEWALKVSWAMVTAYLALVKVRSHCSGLGQKLPNLSHALVATAWTWPLLPIGYTVAMCHFGCAFTCLVAWQ